MNFRTSLQKSAWSCETNMFSAIDQATRLTTLVGASSRSSCVHPKGFRLSASIPRPDTTPPAQDPNAGKQGSSIKVDVNLVVLHTTVIDDRQRFADGLKSENFRVFEDKVEQKLSVFKREDVPVSMGLVIDNSGSID